MNLQKTMIAIAVIGILASTAACKTGNGASQDTSITPAACKVDLDCIAGDVCNAGSCEAAPENHINKTMLDTMEKPLGEQLGPKLTDADHDGKTDQLEPKAIEHVLANPPPFAVPATLDTLVGNWKFDSYVTKDKNTGKKTDMLKSGDTYEALITNVPTIAIIMTNKQGVSSADDATPLTIQDGAITYNNMEIEASIMKGNVMYWHHSKDGFILDATLTKE